MLSWQHKARSHKMQTLEYSPELHAGLVYAMHARPAMREPPPAGPARDQRALRREFSRALAGNDFTMRFLPRYRIASPRLMAAEGMIRWQHRRRGVIPEGLLMGLAAKAGIADEVHRWAIIEGARVLSRLPPEMRLALNIRPHLLRGPALFENIHDAVTQFGITPEQLELSISETTLAGLDEQALMILASLFDDGVAISLSHFGESLGSLNLLTRMPLDCVKLDSSLVRGLPDDPGSVAMIRAAIEVAHSIGARVVALGVETEEQRKVLAKLRCDEVQDGNAGTALTARELEKRSH
jgi:EAL domain-containing protein (putative c-di-GMP-specific phosphodiesterase class I)